MATKSAAPSPALARMIARAARRVRLRLTLYHVATGLLAGSAVSGLLVGLLRADLLAANALPGEDLFFLLPPLSGAILGGLFGASKRVDTLAVARLLDDRLDLKERLSTSVALGGVTDDPFTLRQREDAETHAAADLAAVARAVPLTPLPKHAYIAIGLTLAVFLAWLLPTLPAFQSAAQKAQKAATQREGERLVRIARELGKQADAKKLDGAKAAAKKIEELGKEMQRGKIPRQKAMMKLAKLTEEMKAAQQAAAAQSSPRSLPAAGRDLEKALASANALPKSDSGEQQADPKDGLKMPPADGQNGVKNAQSGKANAQTDHAVKKSQEALAQNDAPSLAEQLSKLADQVARGEPKDAAGRERLAKQMEAMAKALEKTSLSKASEPLEQAAEQMRAGKMPEASEQLREAARRAQEGARQEQDAEALRQSADALMNGDPAEASPGETPGDQGEGQGEGDAFDEDGNAKGKGKSRGRGQGEGQAGVGEGDGQDGANGIGSGHQAVGTNPKKTTQGGKYADPEGAKSGMYDGNWRVNKARDEKFGRVFAPDGKTPNTRVQGKRGDKGKESVSYFRGAPDKVDASTPYYEVYERYAPAAESAMNREDIPASEKRRVRDYFDSLRPPAAAKKPSSGGTNGSGGR